MRFPSRKFALLALFFLALAYILGSWLLLPGVLQSQSEQFIAEKTGHRLTMDRPEFNPFNLSLKLHNLHLAEGDGKELLGFESLLVDFSATSIIHRAWVFDAVRLDGLGISFVALPDQRLNWSALLAALQSKEAPTEPAAPLPRLEIVNLSINGGRIELVDRRTRPEFAAHIEPLDLHLENLSTLPDDRGDYRLSASTDLGAKVSWQGKLTLNPLAATGHIDIKELALARVAPLVKLPLRVAPPEGSADLSANYRLSESDGKIDLALDQIEARITGFKLRTKQATQNVAPLLALDSIALKDGRLNLRQQDIAVGSVALSGGGVTLSRDAEGRWNVLDLLPAPTAAVASSAPEAAPPKEAPAAWHYRIDRIALTGLRADLHDRAVSPTARLALENIAVGIDDVSDNPDQPWPLHASFNVATGGRFEAHGSMTAAQPSIDTEIKLANLSLKPVQPYLGAATTLTLANGSLSATGHARYGQGDTGFNGSATVDNLRLTEEATKADFLVWKSLTARKFKATPDALRIGDLALLGLDTRLIIAADKTVNLAGVVRRRADARQAQLPASTADGRAPPYRVDIDHLRVVRSKMEFADHSLALPFGTRIHHLHGTVNNISSQSAAPGQIELDGQVDDYGVAHAKGQIKLADPTDYMDINVTFKNIEMTRLTPYSATFAGRKIKSGKLSLDLDYKIKQRQLVGENKVVMDQLTLGERVESPQAKDLPLDLAIALLQDSDGRINLGLPVSGSLDDPQFSFGGIVWKVITNVLTKVATAPFRALGALFGGDESLGSVSFDAGRARLAPPEREKLVKLAATLDKRPRLALTLQGTWSEADRTALQDMQLRRAIVAEMGQSPDGHDPGPVSTSQPEVQTALEDLYAGRAGGGALAALKEGFRKANPGQIKEGGVSKMLSGLGNVFREKKDLPESEVAKLKGKDFHAILYQKLRSSESVGDERLKALATARGEAALAELKAANAAEERIGLLAPRKIDATGNEVALGLEAKAAGK